MQDRTHTKTALEIAQGKVAMALKYNYPHVSVTILILKYNYPHVSVTILIPSCKCNYADYTSIRG